MKNLTLQQKIVYPILGAFALVTGMSSWYFVSTQVKETEAWYREELLTLATASGYMAHATADEFMQTKGMRFHRVLIVETSAESGKNEIETRAAAAFKQDPSLKLFTEEVSINDTVFMAVFLPTMVKSECSSCHTNFDIQNSFGQERKAMALFGSSGSMAEIHARETQTKTVVFTLTFLVIAGLGWIVHRSMKVTLLEPMRELKFQTEIVANRDLRKITTPALERKLTSSDEMGHVTRSFATMIQMLRRTIRRMHDASFEVSHASTQITSHMETIASGAEEQMSQAIEVANAIEEMTRTIMENSRSANETAETARKSRLTAEAGGKIVIATAEGMKRIANATGKSSETAQALERSSKKIGEIVKLINDIADQTSLLALNAATEAARAGESGKGFGIVADEVRKLAERTMKATREIDEMIKMIQRDAQHAVKSMNEGTQEVNEGIKLADQAGQSLREIVEISQKVTDMITHIAVASKQQSATSDQISKNVEMISSVTKQMANGTKEVAFASEGLNHLTEQLQKMVNEFILDEDNENVDENN